MSSSKHENFTSMSDKAGVPSPIHSKTGLAESQFASQTPDRKDQPLNSILKAAEDEILQRQRYKKIMEFFDAMTTSLRLLSLRKKQPTFENICAQVQVMTKRLFSLRHLAQIKHLLSEAIQIERILVHDKKTLCMKPDFKILLLFDVVEGHEEHSDYIALRQVFASRLIDYFARHPKACDIPEAKLPNLNNHGDDGPALVGGTIQTFAPEELLAGSSTEYLPSTSEKELSLASSHPQPSKIFNKDFVAEKEEVQLLASPSRSTLQPSSHLDNQDIETADGCKFSHPKSGSAFTNENGKASPSAYSKFTFISPQPNQRKNPQHLVDPSACASPLLNPALSTDNLAVETPAQTIPKRPVSSCEPVVMTSHKHASTPAPAKRSLDFSYVDKDSPVLEKPESCGISYGTITQTSDGFPDQLNKEDECCAYVDKDQKQRQSQMEFEETFIHLPDVISLVHSIFRSLNYCPMTKEELVYKIIVNSFEFDDKRAVEEYIEVLEKLVPDWINRKMTSAGDTVYNIEKHADLASIQARVIQNKESTASLCN